MLLKHILKILQFNQPERYDPLGSYMNGCTINKNNIGMGRTKFKHVEIDKKISEAIQRSNQSKKHEASTL